MQIEHLEILIIEPDVEKSNYLRSAFSEAGYPSHICVSGEEGIKYLETEASPIVFLSDRLPGLSGIEVLNIIESIQPMTQVIYMLGEENLRELMLSIAGRIPNFLFPPLTPELVHLAAKKAEQNYRIEKDKWLNLESLRRDLKIASRIQKQLLTVDSGETDGIFYGGFIRPSGYLTGDFCKITCAAPNIDLILGDISGTGITSAILAQEVIRLAERQTGSLPGTLMAGLNNAIVDRLGSCSLGIISVQANCRDRTFSYCGGGIPVPVQIRKDGSYQFLPISNQAIGILRNLELKTGTGKIEPGDMIFVFTDGLLELGMGQQGAMDEIFSQIFQNIGQTKSLTDFQNAFQKTVHSFENSRLKKGFADDVAMALIYFPG